MGRQLDNTLHYAKLSENPSEQHLNLVKSLSNKWYSEGQISDEIADWVTNIKPKPGTGFGNVKTHKVGSPLQLITSCCGTAIAGRNFLPLLNTTLSPYPTSCRLLLKILHV